MYDRRLRSLREIQLRVQPNSGLGVLRPDIWPLLQVRADITLLRVLFGLELTHARLEVVGSSALVG